MAFTTHDKTRSGELPVDFPQLVAYLEDVRARVGSDDRDVVAEVAEDVRYVVSRVPRLRPYLGGWPLLDQVVAAVTAYASGLDDTDDLDRLEDDVETAVEALDEYCDHITSLGDTLVRHWDHIEAGRAAQGSPTPVRTLAEEGRTRAGEIMGPHATSAPMNVLIELRLAELRGCLRFDVERMFTCAEIVYQRLMADGSSFNRMVGDGLWQGEYVEALRETTLIGEEMRVLPRLTPEQQARNYIRLGHLLVERVAKQQMKTLLRAGRGHDYTSSRPGQATALLNECRDVGLDDLLLGWDAALRHGDAHNLFDVEGETVRFTATNREYDSLHLSELGDRVLAAQESVTGVNLGILCAASVYGVDLGPLVAAALPLAERCGLHLSVLGWSDVEVVLDADSVEVSAVVPDQPKHPGFVLLVANDIPAEVTDATFFLHGDGRDVRWSGPLSEWRTALDSEAEDASRHAAMARATHGWSATTLSHRSST